jgi:predicted dehydrogenase
VAFFAQDEKWAGEFGRKYPAARRVFDRRAILEADDIALVLSAGIPSQRAPLGIEVMQHGKDYCCDKAAFLNLDDLNEARRVQSETRRIFSVCYSERLLEPGAWKTGKLVKSGAIGRVLHQTILAPHALRLETRAPWFFERHHYGGILTDIGSHQVEQFLYFAGLDKAEIVGSRVANYTLPQYPEFEDYGEVQLHGTTRDGHECSAFVRVDWLIPAGATHIGRHRALLGDEGFLEYGYSSLTLTTSEGTHQIDCVASEIEFGRLLVDDVLNRTETAMTQQHCFYASELTLKAQQQAELHRGTTEVLSGTTS